MVKDFDYYMKLPYTIVIKRTEYNGEVTYIARIVEIPHLLGDGKNPKEALECLNTHMAMAIRSYLEDSIPIPEPQSNYSGNINIRVDPELHANLAQEAAVNEMSLNKYASLILERRHSQFGQNVVTLGKRVPGSRKKVAKVE